MPLCDVQSLVYSTTSGKLFIAVIFLKDEEKIKNSCQIIVAPNSILPQATHVFDGLWFVSTQELLTFMNHTCESTNKYDKIEHILPCQS